MAGSCADVGSADRDVGSVDDAVQAGARQVERARRRVEGELIGWLVEVERSGSYREFGYTDLAAWGRGELRWCPVEARSRRGLVGLVREAPVVLEWLLEGRLGVAQAHLLGRLFRAPRVGRHVPDFIESFLRCATELDYCGFEQYCRAWQLLMDQDGSCPDRRRRSAHLGFVGHEFRLAMSGPAIDGVAWEAVLRRFEERELAADWAEARERYGEAATADLLARSPAQRRYDALQNLLAHVVLPARRGDTDDSCDMDGAGLDGFTSDEGGLDEDASPEVTVHEVTAHEVTAPDARPGGPRDAGGERVRPVDRRRPPTSTVVNIVADLPTWLRALDGLTGAARGQPWIEPFGPRRGRCETVDGVQLHPRDVVLASLAGMVRAVVVDQAGRPVQMSSVQRLFRGALADAVRFTASRCSHPGCLVPATEAQVDHLHPHVLGGATTIDNGGLACGHHNTWRYTAGARTTLGDDGVWITHTSDGGRLAPPD